MKYLNVRLETIKPLQENIREIQKYFRTLEWARIFWKRLLKVQETKAKLDKWDYMKLKRSV
jgi:hypothetical protein